MIKKSGFAQLPVIIGLLIMAVAIPAASRLIQENQSNQGKAYEPECEQGQCFDNNTKCDSSLHKVPCGTGKKCVNNSCVDATCQANCSCADYTCTGDRCPNACGGWCSGRKNCPQPTNPPPGPTTPSLQACKYCNYTSQRCLDREDPCDNSKNKCRTDYECGKPYPTTLPTPTVFAGCIEDGGSCSDTTRSCCNFTHVEDTQCTCSNTPNCPLTGKDNTCGCTYDFECASGHCSNNKCSAVPVPTKSYACLCGTSYCGSPCDWGLNTGTYKCGDSLCAGKNTPTPGGKNTCSDYGAGIECIGGDPVATTCVGGVSSGRAPDCRYQQGVVGSVPGECCKRVPKPCWGPGTQCTKVGVLYSTIGYCSDCCGGGIYYEIPPEDPVNGSSIYKCGSASPTIGPCIQGQYRCNGKVSEKCLSGVWVKQKDCASEPTLKICYATQTGSSWVGGCTGGVWSSPTPSPKATAVPTNPGSGRPTSTPAPTGGPPVPPTNPPAPPPGSGCSVTSLQARVQLNSSDPWSQQKSITLGTGLNLGCMKNGSGNLADNVKIVAKYSDGSVSEYKMNLVNQWKATKNGNYTIYCQSTDSKCNGLTSTTNATVVVGSGSCKECPNDFACYGNASVGEYKWFVSGYAMPGFELSVAQYCLESNVLKPTWQGKGKADANCDGVIDINDYSLWRKEFKDISHGEPLVRNNWEADFTGPTGKCDGVVDITDYSLWRHSYKDLTGSTN